ncbi:hypothetical protein FACS189465_1010 [Clostridia bacterium]|nr:hypothetical protein FACS189465_1010 [Clostridia bacterium]
MGTKINAILNSQECEIKELINRIGKGKAEENKTPMPTKLHSDPITFDENDKKLFFEKFKMGKIKKFFFGNKTETLNEMPQMKPIYDLTRSFEKKIYTLNEDPLFDNNFQACRLIAKT